MYLVTGTFAVLFIWDTVKSLSPWSIPYWLAPVLVLSASTALCFPDIQHALAVSGAVGILNSLLRSQNEEKSGTVRIGVGSRLPPMP